MFDDIITYTERKQQIGYLLRKEFPFVFTSTTGCPSFERYIPGEKKAAEAKWHNNKAELEAKSSQEIQKMYNAARKRAEEQDKNKEDKAEQARFFNLPEADADFDYWSKQPFWSLHECAILSLSKDPREVTCERLSHYAATKSEFMQNYENLIFTIKRQFDKPDDLSMFNDAMKVIARQALSNRLHVGIAPYLFIEWVESYNIIKLPKKLISSVEKIKKCNLAYKSLQVKNKALEAQLNAVQTQIQGVSLQEIIKADCLTREMQYMLLASKQFWVGLKNHPEKKHPINKQVVEWLITKEFDPTPAKHMARLIRPEWGDKGPPEK